MPRTPAQKASPKTLRSRCLKRESGKYGHSPAYLAFRGMKVLAAMFRLKKEQAASVQAEAAAMQTQHPKEKR